MKIFLYLSTSISNTIVYNNDRIIVLNNLAYRYPKELKTSDFIKLKDNKDDDFIKIQSILEHISSKLRVIDGLDYHLDIITKNYDLYKIVEHIKVKEEVIYIGQPIMRELVNTDENIKEIIYDTKDKRINSHLKYIKEYYIKTKELSFIRKVVKYYRKINSFEVVRTAISLFKESENLSKKLHSMQKRLNCVSRRYHQNLFDKVYKLIDKKLRILKEILQERSIIINSVSLIKSYKENQTRFNAAKPIIYKCYNRHLYINSLLDYKILYQNVIDSLSELILIYNILVSQYTAKYSEDIHLDAYIKNCMFYDKTKNSLSIDKKHEYESIEIYFRIYI